MIPKRDNDEMQGEICEFSPTYENRDFNPYPKPTKSFKWKKYVSKGFLGQFFS